MYITTIESVHCYCSSASDHQKSSEYDTEYQVFGIWHRPDTSRSGQPVGPCRTHAASSDRISDRVTGVLIQTGGTGWLPHPCGVTGVKSACSPPRTGIIIIIIITSARWYIMLWIFFYVTVRWTVRRSKQREKIKQVFYYFFFAYTQHERLFSRFFF